MYNKFRSSVCILLAVILIGTMYACGSSSSPEGRMSTRMEALKQDLIDSLNKQNKAIRDSLGMIRKDLEQLRESNK